MSVEKDIRFELLARLCPNSTGEMSHGAHVMLTWVASSHGVLHVELEVWYVCDLKYLFMTKYGSWSMTCPFVPTH